MSGSTTITIMTIFFSITTVAVFLYPIIKLTPSWLERSVQRKVRFHRDAVAGLALAMTRAHNDTAQFDRLAAQHAWHRSALAALAPEETVAEAPRFEAAA